MAPATDVDAVVVGAGISGLIAARELRRAGASVVVLEARDRVGGKMHTVEIEGAPVDLGAHWVGPTQRRIGALARDLGIEVEPQYLDGEHLMTLGDRRHAFTGAIPVPSIAGAAETAAAVARIELRWRLIDAEAHWRSRAARRLDAMTLGQRAKGLRSTTARSTLQIVSRTVFGVEPSEVSLLHFLWYVRGAGGWRSLTEFEGAAQDARLVGGAQQVCERLAAELGDAVALGSPVRLIEQGDGDVRVHSARRDATGRRAIVALAPATVTPIEFDPLLPPAREALNQRMPMGTYMKGVAVYDRAWWRDRGLSGLAFADRGPVQMVVDDSPRGGAPGVLVAFITGAPARDIGHLHADERQRAVVDSLTRLLGREASTPTAYRELNWTGERWSRGGPAGVMTSGAVTTVGPALRAPVGRVHWAGTETATEWCGYMDGGIEAGERAAKELLAAL